MENRVYICYPGGKTKALTMSYDDGKLADRRLLEIFRKYGIRGTFNLNSGLMEQEIRVRSEEIRELYRGFEVATHTLTHPTLARCPLTKVAQEVLEDRRNLERITGDLVRGHAYPNGSYSKEIEALLSSLGVAYARTVHSTGGYDLPENPLAWDPTCHHGDPRLMEHAKYLAEFQKKQYLILLYVWGHSYEFDNADNWNVIEEFCAYIGGREDIWYATNIEIIDYLDAARRLQFSASCDLVRNPSAIPVTITTGEEIYTVGPGETLRLA